MRNAVLVDLMRRKRVGKEKCLELLRAHIKQNVWQVRSITRPIPGFAVFWARESMIYSENRRLCVVRQA